MWTLCFLIFFYFNCLSFERECDREKGRERESVSHPRECVKSINETKKNKK